MFHTIQGRLLALALVPVLLAAACGRGDAEAAAPEEVVQDVFDLRQVGYDRGAPEAPVVVIEFSDFGCGFCAMFATGTYPDLEREFVETGEVRWKYVPMVMGNFRNSAEATRAAECAGEQDRFWEMHAVIYRRQREWRASNDPAKTFAEYAREAGVDGARFARCYRADARGDRTRAANRAADAMRVRATPTFVVNGRIVEGALPLESFRVLLRASGAGREEEE